MSPTEHSIRHAVFEDAHDIAELFIETRAMAMPFLPILHSPQEIREYFRSTVITTREVWLAEASGRIVGFCAFRENWVDHLYVHPSYARMGIGRGLLNRAKERYPHLRLWVFARNEAAKAFYLAMSFTCVRETDGRDNEEREPDALFEWGRPNTE